MRKTWPRLGSFGGLVPLVLAGQLGMGGVRSAEACTGGSPGEDWDAVEVVNPGSTRVSVDTDGFVLLRRYYYGELAPQTPGAWVRVQNAQGEAIAGQLRVLLTREDGGQTERYLGWKADEPLEIGTVLTLTSWRDKADSDAGAEGDESLELEVVGEPTPLPTPTPALGDWGEIGHGLGDRTECRTSTPCGPAMVPSREERFVSVQTLSQLPAINGMVAWEFWAEASQPDNGVSLNDASGLLSMRSVVVPRGSESPVKTGVVAFSKDATDHCVVVVAKDLRSGEERRSEPLCQPEGEPRFLFLDHALFECTDPPTAEALPLWCEGRRSNDPRCVTVGGGQGGQGGQTTVDDEVAEAGGDAERPRHDRDGEASDGGCQLASGSGGFGVMFGAWAAAAALLRRRRARR